ncbi:putative spermidine/putrescine transport system permease protein [Rhodococcus sp. OAS809]|uniref:ABC transporter permease n=1 Tax=Rhodococcus sp. OAS809 TaxID=2663874 RepID=UPI00178B7888
MISRFALSLWSLLVMVWLVAPVLIVVPMSFSAGSGVGFPPEGFSLQWYDRLLSDPMWLEALQTSLVVALCTSCIAVVAGTLASYAIARWPGRLSTLLRAASMGPMVVPTIVLSVAIYLVWAKVGLIGTVPGLIIAHTTLALPFVVLVMVNAVSSFDVRIEQAASSLGARQRIILTRVVLPAIAPHAFVAWLFAFIVSFDEVVISSFIAGTHITVPVKMFSTLRNQIDPTITAISTILIAVTLLVGVVAAVLLRRRLASVVGTIH